MMMLSLSLFSLLSFIFFALVEEQEERATIDPLCACSLFSASFFTFLATFIPVTVSALSFLSSPGTVPIEREEKRRRGGAERKKGKNVSIPIVFGFFFRSFVLPRSGHFAPMFPSPWSATASTAISCVAAASLLNERRASPVHSECMFCQSTIDFFRFSFFLSFSLLSLPLNLDRISTFSLSRPPPPRSSMAASSVVAEWASALASRGSVTDEEIEELLGAASLVARGEEAAAGPSPRPLSSSSPSSSSSSPSSSFAARDVLDALRPLCTFLASAVPGKSTSAGNVSRVASAAAVLLASLKSSTAGAARVSNAAPSSPSSSSPSTMTNGDWQSRFIALDAALCASLEAPALSESDRETISGAYAELVGAWLPRFRGNAARSSPSPSPSDGGPLLIEEERSMLTGFKRALRDKASPLPILPAHAAELLSTAVEALEHARRGGRASAGAAGVSSNGENAAAAAPPFTDDTALALGRHAGDDTALALADQLLAISSRGAVADDGSKASSSPSSSSDGALRSRLFEYACRGLREALRDILDDVGSGGGGEPGRPSGGGGGYDGSSSGTPPGSAGGSSVSLSADGCSRFPRASSSSWLLSALADGVSGHGGGGAGGGALAGGGVGGGSNAATFFGAAAAGTAIDLASIRLPSASFAKATATLTADLAIGLDVVGPSSSSSEAKSKDASVIVVVGAKDAKAAPSSRFRPQQRGGPHLALACDLLLESIEACVGLAWQAAGPAAAGTGGGGGGGGGGRAAEEEGSGSASTGTASLAAAALARRALDIGAALASAAPELLDATATAGVAAALDAPERVHALMRSAARLADVVACGAEEGAGGSGGASSSKRIWRWDLESASVDDKENKPPQNRVFSSSFASAEALTDALSSSLTALLAAAWRAGDVEGVKAALVPLADLGSGGGEKVRGDASTASFSPARPSFGSLSNANNEQEGADAAAAAAAVDDDSTYEQQAELLTAGRLAAALAGDAELLAVVVPLLAESGVGGASAPSKATAMHVVASLAALAGCSGHLWAYDAQIDAMVKAYKSSPDGAAGPLLFAGGGGKGGGRGGEGGGGNGGGAGNGGEAASSPASSSNFSPTAGALADALLVAAEGVKHAPLAVRRDLLLRLLALAADVGATTTLAASPPGSSSPPPSSPSDFFPGDSRRDLGALLPAISAVADAAVDRDALSRGPKAASWTDAEQASASSPTDSLSRSKAASGNAAATCSSSPKATAAAAAAAAAAPSSSPSAPASASPKRKNTASKVMAALKKGSSTTPRGEGGGRSDSKSKQAEQEAAEKAAAEKASLIPSFVRRHGEPSAADIVKAFRLLWLYIGMHDFAGMSGKGGLSLSSNATTSNANSSSPASYPWPASWRAAVGRIAAFTPQIAALGEGESVKMGAELGPRVARLGGYGAAAVSTISSSFYSAAPPPARPTTIAAASAAAHARAASGLSRLLGTTNNSLPSMPASPDSPARVAHLLSVATLELSRAELAPLGACVGGGVFDDGGSAVGESDAKAAALPSPAAASPLDLLLDAQQDAEPGLWAGPALAAISDAAAAAYCSRLSGGGGGGNSGRCLFDSSEEIMPALERLISSLVAASARSGVVVASSSSGGATNVSARAPPLSNKKVKPGAFPSALVSSSWTAAAAAAATSGTASSSSPPLPLGTPARILADVLVAFPSLYWRPVLLRSALACCSAEEKMVAPGATTHHSAAAGVVGNGGGGGGGKRRGKSSLYRRHHHHHLDGHPSLALARKVLATAASVAPEHAEALLHEQLRGGGGGRGGGGSGATSSSSSPSSSSAALLLPSSSSASAPAAALRHAAALMATLDAARPRFDAEAPTAPIAGVEALSRKAYYGGAAAAAASASATASASASASPSSASSSGEQPRGSLRGLSEAVERLERVLVAFQQQQAVSSTSSSAPADAPAAARSAAPSTAAPSLPPAPVKATAASLEDAVLSLAAAIVTAAAEEEDGWRRAARRALPRAAKGVPPPSSHRPRGPPQPPPPSPALAAAVRALGAAPARRLTPVAVRVSTMAWAWVAAAAPRLRVPLAAAVAAGWSSTQDAHAGLFSRATAFDAEEFHMSPGGDPDDHPELTRGVKAHAAWLEYWSELWFSVCADGGGVVGSAAAAAAAGVPLSASALSDPSSPPPSPVSFTAAVSADAQAIRYLLSRLLHRALENARHLTQHPASGGLRARLARLALLMARSELRAVTFSSSSSRAAVFSSASVRASNARLLAQRAMRASLLWFEGPPAWYGRWTPDEAEEQVSAAAELAALVGDGGWFAEEVAAGGESRKKKKEKGNAPFPPPSSTSGTGAVAVAAAASPPDPVWGRCPGAAPEQRVALLKLLLDAEVERTASWARPLAVPSQPRSPYARFRDPHWRDLVRAAWAVSPRLALSLPERLPECAPVEEALEALVVAHAGEPELQAVPRGAAILAKCVSKTSEEKKKPFSSSLLLSACACGGVSGGGGGGGPSPSSPSALDPFRSTSPTDALALWAPAPLLQALAMLGGQAGGVPAVRAYALRSLEGCDPEQVQRRGGWFWLGRGGEGVFFYRTRKTHFFLQKPPPPPPPPGLRLPPAARPASPRRRRRADPRLPARRGVPLRALRAHARLHPQRRGEAPRRGLQLPRRQALRVEPARGHGPLGRRRGAQGRRLEGDAVGEAREA